MAWIKKTRSTGWLDVTSTIIPAAGHTSGRMLLRRRGDEVTLLLDGLTLSSSGTQTLITIPTGFRPVTKLRESWWTPDTSAASAGGTLNISTSVVGYQLTAGAALSGRFVWDCKQAWPSTYPGVEVQL